MNSIIASTETLISKIAAGQVVAGIGLSSVVSPTITNSIDEQTTVIGDLAYINEVTLSDFSYVATIPLWESGLAYRGYLSHYPLSANSDFVAVHISSDYHVFKCLFAPTDSTSTVPPSIIGNGNVFTTADRYVWKYAWTVSENTWNKFTHDNHIPVVLPTTKVHSFRGSVEYIGVEQGGSGYKNTLNSTFGSGDVLSSTSLRFPQGATTTSLYNECWIEITTSSSPNYGYYRLITNYDGGTKTASLQNSFPHPVVPGDTFVVSPSIEFAFNKTGISPQGKAVIVDGAVDRVVVFDKGKANRQLLSCNVNDPSSSRQTSAILVSALSPSYGHCGDPIHEIPHRIKLSIVKHLNISTSNLPSSTFNSSTILVDTVISSIALSFDLPVGLSFLPSENISLYNRQATVAESAVVGPLTITTNDPRTGNLIDSGSWIELHGADLTTMIRQVDIVEPDGDILVTEAIADTSQTYNITQISTPIKAEVQSTASSTITIKPTSPKRIHKSMVGTGEVSKFSYAIDSIADGVDQGIQATRAHGSVTGTFVNGETITSGEITATVFGATATDVYMTDCNVIPSTPATFIGQTSGATINAESVIPPIVDNDSGIILTAMYFSPVNTSTTNFTIRATIG